MNGKGRALVCLGLITLPVALLAQTALDQQFAPMGWMVGAIIFAASGIAFTVSFGTARLIPGRLASSSWHDPAPFHGRWLLLGLNLAWIAFFTLEPNQFTLVGTLAWTGAIVSVVWLATERDSSETHQRPLSRLLERWERRDGKRIIALVAVTLLAAFFRFCRLEGLPAEMGLDPPYIFLGAQSILDGDRPIFVTLFPGQESGFFYLVAVVGRFFGLSFFTLKAASALIGTLTVPALLLLGRRLFNETVAVTAAVFLAVNRWHVLMSRTGLRPILMPLIVIGLLWALVYALQKGYRRNFALVGLVSGLGAFTYTGALFLPLVAGTATVLYGAVLARVVPWRIVRRLGLTLLVLIIVIVPLLRYAMKPDNAYLTRYGRRVVGYGSAETNVAEAALGNVTRTIGAFNWRGDNVYAFNLPLKRQLGWVSGALFVLGFIYALSQIQYGPYLLLILALVIASLPTIVTLSHPQEVPNAGRLIGAVVPACLLAALPLGLLYRIAQQSRRAHYITLVLVVFIVALLGIETYEAYHDIFSEFEQVQPHYNMAVSATIADLIDGFSTYQLGSVYVVFRHDSHRGFDFQAVEILSDRAEPGWPGFIPVSQLPETLKSIGSQETLFILHSDDIASLSQLQQTFPDGRVEELLDPAGKVGLRTFVVNEIR